MVGCAHLTVTKQLQKIDLISTYFCLPAPMDYSSISAQNVTFTPNQSEQFVLLRTIADSTVEGRETLSAVLSDGSEGVTIGQETANITITEDSCKLSFFFVV